MFESNHYPVEILARQSVTDSSVALDPNPTTGLQQFGFAIIFFFPVLAFLVLTLRVYGRVLTKQFGLGM